MSGHRSSRLRSEPFEQPRVVGPGQEEANHLGADVAVRRNLVDDANGVYPLADARWPTG